ncbi:MAG: transglycosylase SLT domain-containing protein [Tannerellaceae bacterium]|jgi:membrane-bound lytic murein transglycosylase F|nr:transglycosylase SLT domain-containing protein [Tannerellaceae bacterium]
MSKTLLSLFAMMHRAGLRLWGLWFVIFLAACSGKKGGVEIDLLEIEACGRITAVMPVGSATYFTYRMEHKGDEYEMIRDFASSRKLELRVKVAESIAQMEEMLRRGEADLIAFPRVNNPRLDREFIFCGTAIPVRSALVQAVRSGGRLLTDVDELLGMEVYVAEGSHCHEALLEINEGLGGGIIVKTTEQDASAESLIEKVYSGDISFAIADDRIALMLEKYYRQIDASLALDSSRNSFWMVRKTSPLLAEAINAWASTRGERAAYKLRNKQFYELSRRAANYGLHVSDSGSISPYDSLFRKYSSHIGWDWRLLASLSYQESHFMAGISARSGASGLMGIMPRTAEAFGVAREDLFDPETNICVAVEALRSFGRSFRRTSDALQRMKLTLAAYNAGVGHVQDACRLAGKYGKDSTMWDGNVAEYILLKRNPEFYQDPACKFGYLRGSETFLYVKEVIERYEYYCRTMD